MIRLRAIEMSDLSALRDWRNGLMESGVVRQKRHLNRLNQEEWLRDISRPDSENIMMAVEGGIEIAKNEHATAVRWDLIGVVGLTWVDWARRSAEASIYIGPPKLRGKGYGEAALRALCAYGFETLNLNRIDAEIYAFNEGSLALFRGVGFVEEGRKRQATFYQGNYHDSIIMGLLKEEFK